MIAPKRAFSPMLASPSDGLPDILSRMSGDVAWQWKLDGERMVAHIDGAFRAFSRNLSEYTAKLGDTFINAIRASVDRANDIILDGELVAINKATGRVIPFQNVGRVTRSKNGNADIELKYMVFDIVWLDGTDLTSRGYKERFVILKNLVKDNENVMVVPTIFSRDQTEIGDFFAASVKAGNEGLVAKQCDTPYEFGERTLAWMKLKAMLDTMDVLVMGGIWGTGAKAGTLASYYIGVPDEAGKIVCVGKAATGMSDDERVKITGMLKAMVLEETGTDVWVKPSIILEVAYEEVQSSPKYERGVSLRFPRIIRIREDKNEPDTLERILNMQAKQTRHN
jgi:DNA ligase-1